MALILIVDDEPDLRLALTSVLKKEGHKTLEAGDGSAALETVTRQPVDLVLLDIRLPGADGVEILKDIRKARKDLPVLMVSGYGSVNTAVQVMELGASGYLPKPFGNRQLIETVDKILEAKRLGQDRIHQALAQKLSTSAASFRPTSGDPKPARSSQAWLFALLVGPLLGLLVFAAARYFPFKGVAEYPIHFSNPTALTWDDEQLWVADWVTQTVYRLETRKNELFLTQSLLLPQSHLTGLAVVKDAVYTCDSWKKSIQKRRKDENLSVALETPSPGPNPSGLFWDGRYLWSCDSSLGKIFQHELDDRLTVVASYPSPGHLPVGLIKDENFLWSADAETRKLYRHRLDNQLTVLSSIEISELNRGREPLSAVAFHKGRWWIGRDGKNTLYSLRIPSSR
jgi:CheY-like chemotaxis protein